MGFDIAMTLLSFFGLITNKFYNPAAPFMALVVSPIFGIVANIACGNLWGVINKFCSGTGEFALAYKINEVYLLEQRKSVPAPEAIPSRIIINIFFDTASKILVSPLQFLRKH